MSKKFKLAPRDTDVLEHGIGFGLAIAAGFAGGADGMTPRQIASMIEAMGMQPGVVRTIAVNAVRHSMAGRDVTETEFRDAIAEAVRAIRGGRA